jgi:predicted GNAT family acetyltransferase
MNRSPQPGLDHPIWTALTTRQAHLGQGNSVARRYHADVAPFAALSAETPAAYEALHQLLQPHETVALLLPAPVSPIDALQLTHLGDLHQMVATRYEAGHVAGRLDDRDVIALSHVDANDMLELVQKAKPGPFGTRTHEMGNYIGIREQGRLIAMAGERMCLDGYVEISAVCVDDEWRGRGLAGRLVSLLRSQIEQRGQTPFLHVISGNQSAIGLYERLGFEIRRTFLLARIGHADPASAAASNG